MKCYVSDDAYHFNEAAHTIGGEGLRLAVGSSLWGVIPPTFARCCTHLRKLQSLQIPKQGSNFGLRRFLCSLFSPFVNYCFLMMTLLDCGEFDKPDSQLLRHCLLGKKSSSPAALA
jgi:hypothetical protein